MQIFDRPDQSPGSNSSRSSCPAKILTVVGFLLNMANTAEISYNSDAGHITRAIAKHYFNEIEKENMCSRYNNNNPH